MLIQYFSYIGKGVLYNFRTSCIYNYSFSSIEIVSANEYGREIYLLTEKKDADTISIKSLLYI